MKSAYDPMTSRGAPGPALRHRGRARARAIACVSVMMMMLLALTACNRQSATAVTASGQTAAASSNDKPVLFTVPQDQMRHIQVITVEPSNLARVLRLPGSVTYNSFATTPVITQVSGPVARVLVFPGQYVKAGQPMLEVSSPDFALDRSGYLKAREAYWLSQQTYARATDLYAHHAIAESELQADQAAQQQARADLTAAEQSLRVLGFRNLNEVIQDAATPEIPVLAPISGEVVDRTVAPGQVIQGGSTQCFTISNMSTVWVLANVYQNALGYIHIGQPVSIETDAYPTIFHGRISYLAPALDPTTRTLQVRIVTENPGQQLKKDMYVTVLVNASVIRNTLTVPDSAVLRNSENQPFVYVEAGQNEFARRLVTAGANQSGRTQILSGLSAGERVMGDGSLFVEFANSLR